MEHKFNLGDRVVCDRYDHMPKGTIGIIVAIAERYFLHPYLVKFDHEASHAHEGYILSDRDTFLREYFRVEGSASYLRLDTDYYGAGYFYPASKLTLEELPYDPNQQGDLEDDI